METAGREGKQSAERPVGSLRAALLANRTPHETYELNAELASATRTFCLGLLAVAWIALARDCDSAEVIRFMSEKTFFISGAIALGALAADVAEHLCRQLGSKRLTNFCLFLKVALMAVSVAFMVSGMYDAASRNGLAYCPAGKQ